MDSPRCVYDGGKVYRRVVGMDRRQEEICHSILMVAMVQCYGFTGVCVWWEKVYRRVAGRSGKQDEFFHWILMAVMVQFYGFTGVCVWQGKNLQEVMGRGQGQKWGVVDWVFELLFLIYQWSNLFKKILKHILGLTMFAKSVSMI